MSDITETMPLRGIKCTHYYRKTDEDDPSGGKIFKGFYRISLSRCDVAGGPFEHFGDLDIGNHERAIAFCLSRMSGNICRKMPRSCEIPFEPTEGDVMWSFDLREKISTRYIGEEWCGDPERHVYRSCESTILVRKFIGSGLARYEGIGHMSVLGMAHIVETISKDNHLDAEERANTAMFEFRGRMYVPTMFDQTKPHVFGSMIGRSENEHVEISQLNYHSNFVEFYRFGTVVKCGNRYFLDGQCVHYGGVDQDRALKWIADSYPDAERYSLPGECGSMGYIRNKNDED